MNKEVLKEIGMTDNESQIYLILLANGSISGYKVAEKAGLYKQVTYETLKRLVDKGFASYVMEGKTKIFSASNPELIFEMLNEKISRYKDIIPNLLSLNNSNKNRLAVEIYRGRKITQIALRDIINNLKKDGGEVLCSAIDESLWHPKHDEIFNQYEKDILRYNIREKVIIEEGREGLFKAGATDYRKINKNYFNPNPFQVYGDNVHIILWGNPDHLIIIRNKDIAKAFSKQFELIWSIAKK